MVSCTCSMQEQIAPVWVSQGPQILLENLPQCVFSVCCYFVAARPSAASWSPPWIAGGYLLQCDTPWTVWERFSKLLSRYCRLISAPAPGALPHLPSLTLVSAELILSRLSHSSLTGLVFQARSDVEVLSIHQKLPRLSEGPFIPF